MTLESLLSLNASGMVGQALYRKLLERFGTAEYILRAREQDLRRVPGVGPLTARAILDARNRGARERSLAEQRGFQILAFDAPDSPAPLHALYDRPLVLYVWGSLPTRDALAIGVVGSRRCTSYGQRQARRFGEDLARLGVTVVSGLARGVDTSAHLGALQAPEGRTIAALGSGLARIYPRENTKLAAAIAERGAVLSEFPIESAPEPANFPRRNRIIAGLSLGTLVVEAEEKSGALITADWTMESGRDVFCLPGSVESPMSRGTHLLIKQGAKLVESAPDILEEIPALAGLLGDRPTTLSPVERTILGHLGRLPLSTEQIIARSRLPEEVVSRTIEALSAKQLVLNRDGVRRVSTS